jgi:uroporphyrinogen III methyltransferase/synthase
MGMRNLAKIVDQLIKHGRPPSTPVAVITQGTTSRQKCVAGKLENIVARVKSENLQPPSVVIVGDVVQLRKSLGWFDK